MNLSRVITKDGEDTTRVKVLDILGSTGRRTEGNSYYFTFYSLIYFSMEDEESISSHRLWDDITHIPQPDSVVDRT